MKEDAVFFGDSVAEAYSPVAVACFHGFDGRRYAGGDALDLASRDVTADVQNELAVFATPGEGADEH